MIIFNIKSKHETKCTFVQQQVQDGNVSHAFAITCHCETVCCRFLEDSEHPRKIIN